MFSMKFSPIFVANCPIGGSERREKPEPKTSIGRRGGTTENRSCSGGAIKSRKHRQNVFKKNSRQIWLNLALYFGRKSVGEVYLKLLFFGQTRGRVVGQLKPSPRPSLAVLSGWSTNLSRQVLHFCRMMHLRLGVVTGGQLNTSLAWRVPICCTQIWDQPEEETPWPPFSIFAAKT